MDKKRLLEKASDNFLKKRYQDSLDAFLAVLREDPENKEAKLGAIICDLLSEDEEEATALFDYYLVLKEEGAQEPEEEILQIIESLDKEQEQLGEILEPESPLLNEGISYADFKVFVRQRGGFKRAFEDIMYSTKVIITQKKDFFDFLDNLIKHGFTDMVYSYLEDASKLYPTDKRIQEFINRLNSEKA